MTTLTSYAEQLEALQQAAASVPSDLPRLGDTELVGSLQDCGASKCPDGSWGNTITVSDLDEQVAWAKKAAENAKNGTDRANLETLKGMGYLERLGTIRYYALAQPDSTQTYDEGSNAHWRGHLAVWDAQGGTWTGRVSITLEGPDPKALVTNVEIGKDGSQTITYIDDPSGDRSRAQSTFDATRRRAFEMALATGDDIAHPEQALRHPPKALSTALPPAGIAVVGAKGVLGVLGSDGLHRLAPDEVTDLWATSGGLLLKRAMNALPDGTPDLLHAREGQLHDLRFWKGWGPSHDVKVRVMADGAIWAFDGQYKGISRVGTWVGHKWRDLDVSSLTTGRAVDLASSGSTTLLLGTDDNGGALLHRHDGTTWTTTPIAGRPYAVAASTGAAFVGTDKGSWRVGADGALSQLHKHSAFRVHAIDTGAVVGLRSKGARQLKLARIEGDTVKPSGVRVRDSSSYAVGRGGQIAAQDGGAVVLSVPGSQTVRCEVDGGVRSIALDANDRVWVGTESGLFACVGGTVSKVPLRGVEGLEAGIRTVTVLGEGLDPSTIAL